MSQVFFGARRADPDRFKTRVPSARISPAEVAHSRHSTPKTHQARAIDLDERTVEQVRAHKKRQEFDPAAWGPGYQPSDLVFRREDGSPIHPDLFSQAFEKLVRDSGLPRIRLHDRRHTHATIALLAGVPMKVMSERLGHEDPAFTMKQYAHVIPGMHAEAAALVAALVAAGGHKT